MTKPIAAFLAVTFLLVSGCVPRASTGLRVPSAAGRVSFPALLVEYDQDGEASVPNTYISELSDRLDIDLSALSLDAETIGMITDSGIGAIHIDNQPGGLRFFMDGEPYLSLVWDDDARAGLVTTLEQMGTDADPIAGILTLLPDLGMGLTMAMPGASSGDLRISGSTLLDKDAADGLLATARAVNPIQTISLSYNEQGTPEGALPPTFTMFGLTHEVLTLSADTLASLQDQGIESIFIMPTGAGLRISINGNDLPFISWNRDELNRITDWASDFANPDNDALAQGMIGGVFTLLGLPIGFSFEFPS